MFWGNVSCNLIRVKDATTELALGLQDSYMLQNKLKVKFSEEFYQHGTMRSPRKKMTETEGFAMEICGLIVGNSYCLEFIYSQMPHDRQF